MPVSLDLGHATRCNLRADRERNMTVSLCRRNVAFLLQVRDMGLAKAAWGGVPRPDWAGGRLGEKPAGRKRLARVIKISALLFTFRAICWGLCEEYLRIDCIDGNAALKAAIPFFCVLSS
ncbi:hypothetical protein [Paraburkholderia sp. J12]|uniref:hypothetical protein n=1 Tax=Paraburkholderia sp. J12 TaxID=2805432 RepID=UPI002ABDFA4F|nr:hypothetical protein [Paraburkholderia sp. J12]